LLALLNEKISILIRNFTFDNQDGDYDHGNDSGKSLLK
jgi:hypothetical protein